MGFNPGYMPVPLQLKPTYVEERQDEFFKAWKTVLHEAAQSQIQLFSRIEKLLEIFHNQGMSGNFGRWYCSLIYTVDFQVFAVRRLLHYLTICNQGIFSFESWYFILKEPASRLHSILYIRMLLENLISQGMPVNLKDWWYLVLQEAAIRQLVIINQVQKLLENGINQGLIIVFIGDRLWTVQNELRNVELGLKSLILYEICANKSSWNEVLQEEYQKQYYKELSKFVSEEREKGEMDEIYEVYPPAEQVFNWTKLCRVNHVKVVILGQDPYPTKGQAHGLAFSLPSGQKPLKRSSLPVIFEALEKDGFKPPGQFKEIDLPGDDDDTMEVWQGHGTLIGWAVQGVLLLNVCLTVRRGQRNSHKDKGWETFTSAVLTWLIKNGCGIVFMLWGDKAKKLKVFSTFKDLMKQNRHKILPGVHPSPLNGLTSDEHPFIGCKHFSKCNKRLEKVGKTPIDWSWLPDVSIDKKSHSE